MRSLINRKKEPVNEVTISHIFHGFGTQLFLLKIRQPAIIVETAYIPIINDWLRLRISHNREISKGWTASKKGPRIC